MLTLESPPAAKTQSDHPPVSGFSMLTFAWLKLVFRLDILFHHPGLTRIGTPWWARRRQKTLKLESNFHPHSH